mmetsp:Transcript_18732/g.47829  ORF Transcript_18732/g.47829 Transcript_18732/m.47829 type:complete len:292 (-) Transcript_18732:94-969(-)
MSARIPELVLASILAQALRGLVYLHSQRHQVHRDLKPANLLISGHGVVQLSDFGITKALDNTRGMATSFVGTALYMAPERISGEEYTYAADVWALGVLGLEGARGVHPFGHLHSYYDLVEALSLADEVPVSAEGADSQPLPPCAADFVTQCLRKKAIARPTAEQLLEHALVRLVAKRPAATNGGGGGDETGGENDESENDEIDALRLGAIVRDWLDSLTLPNASLIAEAADTASALPPGTDESAAAALSRPARGSRSGAREISGHMGELERQLAGLELVTGDEGRSQLLSY